MKKCTRGNRGFTLIASLLLLLLLSVMAIGLMMMVNTEGKVGSTDLQNDIAFHAAEGGMETMYSNVSMAITNAQSPTVAQICAVNGDPPSMTGVSFPTFFANVTGKTSGGTVVNCSSSLANQQIATPTDVWGQIVSGPNQGLYAQIIPINLTVTAQMTGGQEVSMYRQSQIALIPVFQYGVFCEGDCAFFMNPTIDFGGRLHANGDLYLGTASGDTTTFHSKLEAYGNVVTNNLPNQLTGSSVGNTGDVYIPTADGDCNYQNNPSTTTCVKLPAADGSVTGIGGAPPATLYNTAFDIATYASAYNTAFNTFSASVNHELINGDYGNTTSGQVGTGAKRLTLPFVSGTAHAYELIRRPTPQDSLTLSESRDYNIAAIHVLLSDDPADLPGGASDSNNVRLANVVANSSGAGASNPYGIAVTTGTTSGTGTLGSAPSGQSYTLYFAAATNSVPSGTCTGSYNSSAVSPTPKDTINCLPDWPYPPAPWTQAYMTNSPGGANSSSNCILLCPSSQTNPWSTTNTSGVIGAPFVTSLINTTLGSMTGSATLNTATNGGTFQGSNGANSPPTFVPCPQYATSTTVPGPTGASGCPLSGGSGPTAPYYLVDGVMSPSSPSPTAGSTAAWNLIDGWLRVEYADSSGNWHAVTNEWLGLGFARDVLPPTANGAGTPSGGTKNPINPNAILLLQEPADRFTTMPSGGYPTSAIHTSTNTGFSVNTGTWGTAPAPALPTCTASGSGASEYCTAWSVNPPQVYVDSNTSSWLFGASSSSAPTTAAASVTGDQSPTRFNWYPINFYDAREGEPRDTQYSDDSCTTNGVMNAVELDVGNLARWLSGAIGTSGSSVNYLSQNGYILYFSDRRGVLMNPHPPMNPTGAAAKTGDSGLEDVINPSVAAGTPNGSLDTPEDTNQNGYLDSFGPWNEGLGFYGTVGNPVGEPVSTTCTNATMPCVYSATSNNPNPGTNLWYQITSNDSTTSVPDPFGTATGARINSCGTTGRKNWVSGARHVLKLVDASLGNLPLTPVQVNSSGVSYYGGFTVASENPVYVQGDYNSNSSDTFFSAESDGTPGPDSTSPIHAPAAIIADTITFLSDAWVDANSTLLQPTQPQTNRASAANTYYRVAAAAGKPMEFPFPSWENSSNYPTGTDGGVPNFLRFLEDWSGNAMHYGGSMVSMYYSTYNTGMFKCCTYSVYRPPVRDYYFDTDFKTPQGLPPGTPMFRDVESLGYRQLFTPRTQ